MSTATLEAAPSTDPVSPDEALERSRIVLSWLLEGVLPSTAVDLAQREWAVGLRMAQIYVKRAKELLAEEAEEEELRYYRRLSQQQRDRLIFVLFRALKNAEQLQPEILRSLASIITAGTKLLESRDRLVLGEAKDAERERKRLEAAEVNRFIAEAEEQLKRGKELLRTGPTPKPPPKPSAPPLVRPLELGEPVFDKSHPVNQHEMTPRQLKEWDQCVKERGDPRKFPWFKDGALDEAFSDDVSDHGKAKSKKAFENAFKPIRSAQLKQAPNPASQVAIVPDAKKEKVKKPEQQPQANDIH